MLAHEALEIFQVPLAVVFGNLFAVLEEDQGWESVNLKERYFSLEIWQTLLFKLTSTVENLTVLESNFDLVFLDFFSESQDIPNKSLKHELITVASV